MERTNFKRLLRACEALLDQEKTRVNTTRLAAYWPTLQEQFKNYRQSSPHKREKLEEYEKRVGKIAAAVLSGVSNGSVRIQAKKGNEFIEQVDEIVEDQEGENIEKDEEELSQMAKTLKEANIAIRRTIQDDTKVVDQLDGAVQTNLQRLKTQTIRLKQSNPSAFTKIIRLLALLVVALIIFIIISTFIRWVPRRQAVIH